MFVDYGEQNTLFEKLKNIPVNSTLLNLLRDAWVATGKVTALLRAEQNEICTNIIKRALPRRNFALQKLSLLHSSEVVRSRNMDKRLRVHCLPLEEHLNS
jgi:hypothetical protein